MRAPDRVRRAVEPQQTFNIMGKKSAKSHADSTPGTLKPPESGVKVRMYRQGHGDCFLLTFRQDNGEPFYMLIDCGMKRGSTLKTKRTIREVAQNIWSETGGHLHLVVITHEHEDHVSGFLSESEIFSKMTIDKLWLAWTEDGENDLANNLRAKYKDILLGLVSAAEQLKGAREPADQRVRGILDAFLGFDLSESERAIAVAEPEKIKGITNKKGILVVKDRADQRDGTDYLRPHTPPRTLAAVSGVRCFVLGPPESEAQLKDMEPRGDEEFHLATPEARAAAAQERLFLAAAEERSFLAATSGTTSTQEAYQPFAPQYRIPFQAAAEHSEHGKFFEDCYGLKNRYKADDDRTWRRIDTDWLRVAEQFALRMGDFINNTSLVLAIELPASKKVLLLAADAQRGNWTSWVSKSWGAENGLTEGEEVTVRDLLGRTVFYKVGHHGSHNATMNKGGLQDMARGAFADEFVAMIPAHEAWALSANTPPWRHPLPVIYTALREKARGRVFVMDRDLEAPKPQVLATARWQQFLDRSNCTDLFYEYTIED
jgi:hypothetical protein